MGRLALLGAGAGAASIADGLKTRLMAYWKLDEASDGSGAVTRNDSIGANHLTDTNTVVSSAGIIGNAGSFVKAENASLGRTSTTDLQSGDIDFSIALWVYPLEFVSGGRNILGKANYSGGWTIEYWIDHQSNGKVNIYIGGTSLGLTSDTELTLNQWNFVVVYHDSVNDLIGIQINNGIAKTKATAGVAPTAGSTRFFIGSSGSDGLTGYIDEVGYWKRLLTTAEKTYLYNSGGGRQYPF